MRTLVVLLAVTAMTAPAMGGFFSPGEPNGWDFNTPMTETFGGSGIWEYTWTGTPDVAPTLFDILSEAGNWDSKVHAAGNQWVIQDASDGNTLSLDTNTYDDDWFPATNRVGVAYEPTTTWTAVGNWQNQIAGGGDWDNAHPGTSMMDMGGGIFMQEFTLAAGTYLYKAVSTGTWDAIGMSSRNVNSDNLEFTTDAINDTARMWVDVFTGTVKVDIVPEPATLALLGLGGVALLRRRR